MKKFKEYLKALSTERLTEISKGYPNINQRLPEKIRRLDISRGKEILKELNKRKTTQSCQKTKK